MGLFLAIVGGILITVVVYYFVFKIATYDDGKYVDKVNHRNFKIEAEIKRQEDLKKTPEQWEEERRKIIEEIKKEREEREKEEKRKQEEKRVQL